MSVFLTLWSLGGLWNIALEIMQNLEKMQVVVFICNFSIVLLMFSVLISNCSFW